ncbi:glycosyltransferase family 2 protein [Actinomadura oligospora]|uniref:glycosyltransferase family 2 protein n=1 Tax=Actinomadura oligospora TaxID=111804 RepID=UPI00047B0499|nr:glycosyltransferase [Actinomadura oligospora]
MSTVDAVVLTMNDRPDEFAQAMASLLAQEGVTLNVVVVGNGCVPDGVPDGVRTVTLPENVGIPEGRNVGADALGRGEFVLFFDNDAVLPRRDDVARLVAELERHPGTAYVQPRFADPVTGVTLARWVPRPRGAGPRRGGAVATMSEGIVLVGRADFERAGGWPGHYFLFHEGLDLAWRLWDLGRTGRYAPHVVVHHPATDPARHAGFHRLSARNRVWAAYRNLPMPLTSVYVGLWAVLTLARVRSRAALGATLRGFREGLATRHEQVRKPISWRTVGRLTRVGRPPVI